MATTRIMPLHVGKGRTESRAISDIIDYVANPKKTDNGRLITGYAPKRIMPWKVSQRWDMCMIRRRSINCLWSECHG